MRKKRKLYENKPQRSNIYLITGNSTKKGGKGIKIVPAGSFQLSQNPVFRHRINVSSGESEIEGEREICVMKEVGGFRVRGLEERDDAREMMLMKGKGMKKREKREREESGVNG